VAESGVLIESIIMEIKIKGVKKHIINRVTTYKSIGKILVEVNKEIGDNGG
jgi:hypothetical protein